MLRVDYHPRLKGQPNWAILASLERLKRLEIVGQPNNHNDVLKQLVNLRKTLRRTELKLFYHGVEIITGHEFKRYTDTLEPQLRNYKRLDEMSFVCFLSYTDLMRFVDSILANQLPANFFDVFFSIQKLVVTAPVDRDQFFQFIRNLKSLTDLELNSSSLNESVVELPNFCDLTSLQITEQRDAWYFPAKLRFILKFKHLRSFGTSVNSKDSLFALAICSFRLLHLMQTFCFRENFSDDFFRFTKSSQNDTFDFKFFTADRQMPIQHDVSLSRLVELYVQYKHNDPQARSWVREIIELTALSELD